MILGLDGPEEEALRRRCSARKRLTARGSLVTAAEAGTGGTRASGAAGGSRLVVTVVAAAPGSLVLAECEMAALI